MTEYEKAEQEVAAAKVSERVAEWKAMEAKAVYYRYASEAMQASAEVMGARIRRDNAIASEFVDKAIAALSTETEEGLLDPESPPVDDEVRNQADGAAPLLWCMHELAQDELYAAPSFEEAAAVADWANETFKQRDEDDPRMRFQIELWPYSAEAHAAGLVEWAKGWATKRNGDPIDWINNPPKAAPLAISGVKRTSDESQASSTEAVIPEGFTKWDRKLSDRWTDDALVCCWMGGDRFLGPVAAAVVDWDSEEFPVIAAKFVGWSGEMMSISGVNLMAVAPYETLSFGFDGSITKTGSIETSEPPSELESQPEVGGDRVEPAASSPLNEDEGLMWSNGFQTDAKSKAEAAEQEEAKRPFWMFAKKELA